MKETAIIILAGGSSSRLGRPKQVLPLGESTLIERIARTALGSALGKVFVVTGAHEGPVREALARLTVTIVQNDQWEEGMSSSIRTGIKALVDDGYAPAAVILCVCDQPFVTTGLLSAIVRKKEEVGKGMIACAYAGTIGVPVLFDSRYFYNLRDLAAGEGAKSLLFRYSEDVDTIAFPDGAKDIDTEEDYRQILEHK